MRSIFKAMLAILPVALYASLPAEAATESWRQSCSGPEYVCGSTKADTSPSVAPVKKAKPATTAKVKAKAPVAASADDETPAKPKKAKKVATKAKAKAQVAEDDEAAVKPAKKKVAAKVKAKAVAKAQDDDDAPAKPAKKKKVAKASGGGSEYQSGMASWYGGNFHGRTTANGEKYDMWAMTAAHKTLPFGTRVKVTNTRNGDTVVVRINDRGPFVGGRVIDLSRAAANDIGMANSGVAPVKLTILGKG